MKESNFSPLFFVLILIQFALAFAFYVINPIMTPYFESIGKEVSFAGFITGLYAFTAMFSRPFSGFAVDRFSTRGVAILFVLVQALGTFGFYLVESNALLIVFRILTGLGYVFSGTALMSITCEFVSKERMSEGVTYMGLGRGFASVIGPAAGSFLSSAFTYRSIIPFSGCICICTGIILLLVKTQNADNDSKAEINEGAAPNKIRIPDFICFRVIPITLFAGMFSFISCALSSFILPYRIETSDTELASVFLTVFAISAFVLRIILGPIIDKVGYRKLTALSLLLSAVGMYTLTVSANMWLYVIAAIIISTGQGSAQPAIQAECIKIMGSHKRGVAISTYYLIIDIAEGLGPTVGGALAESFGYARMFRLNGLFLAFGLIAFALMLSKKGHREYERE